MVHICFIQYHIFQLRVHHLRQKSIISWVQLHRLAVSEWQSAMSSGFMIIVLLEQKLQSMMMLPIRDHLGKPESIKIPVNSPNAGWDPTDTDPANPWLKNSAAITGAADITVKVGEKANLKANVHATDTCGNDITSKIITIGHYTFDQVGEYDIKYKVTDAIGSVAEKTVKLKVVE